MNTSRPAWRAALLGIALSVVCVLLLAPPTGWLARAQFAAIGFHLPQSDEQRQNTEAAQHARAARRFPNDVDVQIAAALDRAPHVSGPSMDIDTPQVTALHTLLPHFSDQPVLYATILRYEMGDSNNPQTVYLYPTEEVVKRGQAPLLGAKYTPVSPALLAAYDADCAAGERLDPKNAFFPMMRAIGLYAAQRDAEGTDAVLRAGREPVWNDYTNSEAEGRLRIADTTNGGQQAFDRAAITASIPFRHFAPLRGVARIVVVKAMQQEQAGDVEAGLTIRRALMNTSDRMRVQSTSSIGSLVGMAISAIAVLRPGGAPVLKGIAPPGLTDAQRWQWYDRHRTAPFAAYVVQHGHPELADIVRAQAAAGDTVHAEFKQAEPKAFYGKLIPLATLWITNEEALAVIPWLLLLGGVARLLARRAAFREVRPLPHSTKWGIGAAFLVVVSIIAYGLASNAETGFNVTTAVGAVIVVSLASVFWRRRHITRPGVSRFACALLVTPLVLGTVAGILSWQGRGIGAEWLDLRALFSDSGNADSITQTGAAFLSSMSLTVIAPLALSFLMLLIFAIRGRVRRVPVNVAVMRGFLSASVPIACILLLVWGGLCLVTVRQERQLNTELDQMIMHEGRYYASLTGAQWPGPAVP